MSIAESIAALQADKAAIAAAITAKGGTVNEGDGYNDFATDIGTISGGGATRETTSSLGYVASDIVYHFDGDKNVAGYPHDSNMTTKWCDLKGNGGYRASGNIGANYYQTNGTRDTIIKLPSIYDIQSQITLEITFEIDSYTTGENDFCSNFNSSGIGIYKNNNSTKIQADIRLGGIYNAIIGTENIVLNKKYCAQAAYDGSAYSFYINGAKQGEMSLSGYIQQSSDAFGIGGAGRVAYQSNIKCYALRVYSRGLTEAELAQNWAADAERFGIT